MSLYFSMHEHCGEHLSYMMLNNMITCVLVIYVHNELEKWRIIITKGLLHHSIEQFGYLCSYVSVTHYDTCYRRKLVCNRRCCYGYQLLNGRCEGNSILHPLCTLICMYPQQVYFRWFWKCHCDWRGSPTSAAPVTPCWSSHPNAAQNWSPSRKLL